MTAVGHKHTQRSSLGKFALPLKADMRDLILAVSDTGVEKRCYRPPAFPLIVSPEPVAQPGFPASVGYDFDPGSNVMRFLAVIAVLSVAMCLVPAGAHLFEFANKMSMSQPEYMTVQKIYAGWSFFGITVIAALLITLIHTFMVRGDRPAFLLSLAAFLCLAATQGIFWMFTYPMNVASNNWTVTPADFESARRQWEYSHAVSAVLTFIALVAITASVVICKRERVMMRAPE